jgi:hypothetical protein
MADFILQQGVSLDMATVIFANGPAKVHGCIEALTFNGFPWMAVPIYLSKQHVFAVSSEPTFSPWITYPRSHSTYLAFLSPIR